MKIGQFLVKFGSKSAEIRDIFSQFLAAAFLARNVSQNHFSFSREMREMCISTKNNASFLFVLSAMMNLTSGLQTSVHH